MLRTTKRCHMFIRVLACFLSDLIAQLITLSLHNSTRKVTLLFPSAPNDEHTDSRVQPKAFPELLCASSLKRVLRKILHIKMSLICMKMNV